MKMAGSEYVTNISSFSVKSITRFKKKSGKKRIDVSAPRGTLCANTTISFADFFVLVFNSRGGLRQKEGLLVV